MDPLSCSSHPPPFPGVDYLTSKGAWELIHESLKSLMAVGTNPIIEKQVFREHPKRLGDFSETFEVRVGKRLIKVDIEFISEKGLHVRVSDEASIVQDEWFTRRSQYEAQLSSCLLV